MLIRLFNPNDLIGCGGDINQSKSVPMMSLNVVGNIDQSNFRHLCGSPWVSAGGLHGSLRVVSVGGLHRWSPWVSTGGLVAGGKANDCLTGLVAGGKAND